MTPTAVQAIQAMVAPVVLITATAILSGGIQSVYASVNDRMRAMTRERLQLLSPSGGPIGAAADLGPAEQERLAQIDTQLPMLLRRHRLLRDCVLILYLGAAILVVSVVVLGAAVTVGSEGVGVAALCLVLVGTSAALGGLVLAARSILVSQDAIDYEVGRTLGLGA